MYKIEKTNYGIKLTFGGFIQVEEMAKWVEESTADVKNLPDKFGVFVDMRELKPLPADSQEIMKQGQKLYKEVGMERSVVILNSPVTALQFKRIAKETGIYAWERYIDASSVTNWEKVGIDWITNGTDPDSK